MDERTLLFLYRPKETQILLAMKKRGFGEGKWNGVGGKIEEGESIEEATIREMHEEIGVKIEHSSLESRGILQFSFVGSPDDDIRVHVFVSKSWIGEPIETEEMRPRWYDISEIPYQDMWVDDAHWLPCVIKGEAVNLHFSLSADGSEIISIK